MKNNQATLCAKGKVYLRFATIATLLLVSISFIGCSDDDDNDWIKTKANGQPSRISTEGENTSYFYYKNNQLIKRTEQGLSATEYTYEKKELTKRHSYMTTPDIMDGSSETTFERNGNIITTKSTGEPGGNFHFIQEIELGTNELPIKITNLGYKYDNNEYPEPKQTVYYHLFTYDESGKILIKKEVYEKETDKKVGTYTYEYDSNKGVFSNNRLPAWYNIYLSEDLYSFMHLCTTNNIVKINIVDYRYNDDPIRSATFTYEYNNEQYPVRVSSTINGTNLKQSIDY